VGYGAPAQFRAPGLLGVPVSVTGSNVENFDAGTLVSSTGPELVIVRSPVDWIALNVDWSECCSPGVWPGGFPEAFPHTQPTMIGWIAACALDADSRPATTIAPATKTRLIGLASLLELDGLRPTLARSP
jgi:hypothetical protein